MTPGIASLDSNWLQVLPLVATCLFRFFCLTLSQAHDNT